MVRRFENATLPYLIMNNRFSFFFSLGLAVLKNCISDTMESPQWRTTKANLYQMINLSLNVHYICTEKYITNKQPHALVIHKDYFG